MGLKKVERDPVAETVAVNKKLFWVTCLVGLLLVGAGILSLRVDKSISATGVVMAEEEVYVFAPADGVLAGHFVRIGQSVARGSPVFSLEDDDLHLRLLEKKRRLLEVQAERTAVDLAIRKTETQSSESGMFLASPRDSRETLNSRTLAGWQGADLFALEHESFLQRHRDLSDLQEVLQDEVEVLRRQQSNREVTSPIDGTVIDIYRRNPGLALQAGEPVMKIVSLGDGYRIKTRVPQRNIDLLRKGTPVRMESQVFDSMFEGYVTGKIERIAAEAEHASRGELEDPRYEVTVKVDQSPYPLVLGSGMKVDFLLGRQSLVALMMNRTGGERQQAGGAEKEGRRQAAIGQGGGQPSGSLFESGFGLP